MCMLCGAQADIQHGFSAPFHSHGMFKDRQTRAAAASTRKHSPRCKALLRLLLLVLLLLVLLLGVHAAQWVLHGSAKLHVDVCKRPHAVHLRYAASLLLRPAAVHATHAATHLLLLVAAHHVVAIALVALAIGCLLLMLLAVTLVA